MELDAMERGCFVLNAHNNAVFGLGGDFQHAGEGVWVDDQRVIPGDGERIWEVLEYAFSGVADLRGFAVH